MSDNLNTLGSLFEESVKRNEERIALSFVGNKGITYDEMDCFRISIASWLIDNGISKGDKVAILSENTPNWVITFWSLVSIGAVCVPILPEFSTAEIDHILKHSETKILFISDRLQKKNPNLEFAFAKVKLDDFTPVTDNAKSILETNDASVKSEIEKIEEQITSDDLAFLIYTSGTTGKSKGVMLSHGNLTYETKQTMLIQDVNEKDVFLSILPLSHVYENILGMILPIRQGASIYYISKPPTPTLLMDAMKKVRPTMILTVPLIIEKIYSNKIKPELRKNLILRGGMHVWPIYVFLNNMAGKKLKAAMGGRLRFFGIGGAPLNPDTERFLRDARFPYSCGYGLTETSSIIFGSKVGTVKYRSVGPPIPGLNYKVVKAKPSDETGEIIVQWGGNMKGYYKQPDATNTVLTEGNWFHTGDLGTFKNGNMYIRGRSKTMILGPSGENIYPEEIESIINKMEGVIESLVYEVKGKIVAKVYLNIDEMSKKYEFLKDAAKYHSVEVHHKLTGFLTDMRNKLNSHLNNFSQVSKVEIVHQPFEKTPTHKIKRYNHH